jgi:hypothetical protein
MAQNLKINITAQDKTKQALSGVRGRLAGLKRAIFSVQGALVALGGGLAIRSIIGTGRSIEDLNVRLKQLFGSAEEGAKAFDVMANFAAKVPFSLEQIQQASGNLAVVATDANQLSKILEITGNVAAVTGLDFAQTAEQIQRSFAGGISAADVFREKGVRNMLGFSAGATVSAEETIKAFEKVFSKGGQFGKATEELAMTFTGTLSMLGDKLFNFKRNIAGEGFFDEMKKEFKSLNDFIEENSADFEAIGRAISKVLTLSVKAFATAIRAVGKAVGFLRTQYERLMRLLGKDIVVEIQKAPKAVEETNVKLGKQQTLFEKIAEGIKKQNEAFNLSKEITGSIVKSVGSISKSIAETIVLGKELNATLKQLAQSILVEIISKTIERIALLGIEKVLTILLNSKESEKENLIRKQNTNLKRQIALQATLNAMGGGGMGGGGSLFSLFGFGRASGGSVQKGQPYLVGERGAELFIPNQSGQITQSARGTGGGAVSVNFAITTLDATGFQDMLVQNRGTISSIINQAVNERGSNNLV